MNNETTIAQADAFQEGFEDGIDGFILLELCKQFTDDSTKALNSTTIYNLLKRNKIKSVEDLLKVSKYDLILFHGVGMKRLSIIMQMKYYITWGPQQKQPL